MLYLTRNEPIHAQVSIATGSGTESATIASINSRSCQTGAQRAQVVGRPAVQAEQGRSAGRQVLTAGRTKPQFADGPINAPLSCGLCVPLLRLVLLVPLVLPVLPVAFDASRALFYCCCCF